MRDLLVYLNNCKGRKHAEIYRDGAFYDLDTTGIQATQANDLPIGQECVVAAPAPNGRFTFTWYAFQRETILADNNGIPCRVFFGEPLASETLSKERAARSKRYAPFFDRRGHFKQQSAITASLPRKYWLTRRTPPDTSHPEEIDSLPEPMHEGRVRLVMVNAYERNPAARRACIAHYGYDCAVCGFNFAAFYGPLGDEFIHVHHLRELSNIGEEYEVDPIADLRPVCPNCHAMLHRTRPAMSIEELRSLVASQAAIPKTPR